VVLLSVLLLAGCAGTNVPDKMVQQEAQTTMERFEGALIGFEYSRDQWNLSKTEDKAGNSFVTLYNPGSGSMLTMIEVEGLDINPENYFKCFREYEDDNAIIEEKVEQESKDGVTIDTMYYKVDQSTSKKENFYYFYARCYQFEDDTVILTASECYSEEQFETIKQIHATLELSDEAEPGGLSVSKDREKTFAEIIQDYLRGIRKATARNEQDKTFYHSDQYEILREVELLGRDNMSYNIFVPETDRYDGEYYYYDEHGISISVNWSYSYNDELADYLEEEVSDTEQFFHDYARDYQEVKVQDAVVGEDTAYQIVEAKRSNYSSGFEPYITVFHITQLPQEKMLHMQIELSTAAFDDHTNQILKELSAAYSLPLEVYHVDPDSLTQGGKRIESGQEEYQRQGDDKEVLPIEAFPMIGTALYEVYNEDYTLTVPRGRSTRHFGSSITFDMYGIRGTAGINSNYDNLTCDEYANKKLAVRQEYDKSDTRHYKMVSDIKMIPTGSDSAAIAAYSAYKVEYDGSEHLICKVWISRQLEDGQCEDIELELQTDEFSRKTDELLAQYSSALNIDLTQIVTILSEQ